MSRIKENLFSVFLFANLLKRALNYRLLSLLFFFLFLSLSIFPKDILALSADCYIGSTKIALLSARSTWQGTTLFFVPDTWGQVMFSEYVVGDARSNEVYYKIGNSDWFPLPGEEGFYYGAKTIDSDPCGKVWVNVRWRSNTDGQLHYCNVLMPKYSSGNSIANFLQPSCLSSGCTATAPSNAKGADVWVNSHFWAPSATTCREHKINFQNSSLFFNLLYPNDCQLMGNLSSYTNPGETVSSTMVPEIPKGLRFNYNQLQFFNYINDSYCGGAIIDVLRKPTPVACSLGSQQEYYAGTGTPLVNDYNATGYKSSPQYSLFTVNSSGSVNKVEIYGSLDRDVGKGNKELQCKITDSTGNIVLGESSINNNSFNKGNSWMSVNFTNPVGVAKDTQYRLYCKVNNKAGGGYIYWLDFFNNRTDKTRKVYLCEE